MTSTQRLFQLGNLPSHRIMVVPAPGTATVADLVAAGKPVCDAGGRMSKEPITRSVPTLVCWMVYLDNTPAELARKRDEYFRAGVRLLWEIDLRTRTVREFTTPDQARDLTAADTLDGRDVLPGFSLPLADLFAELDRHG